MNANSTQPTSTTAATFEFTDGDLKELGFTGQRALDYETRERCRAVPVELGQIPPESIFGKGSDSAIANRIAVRYPPLYVQLKKQAKEQGII
jgi:hypothetical protein